MKLAISVALACSLISAALAQNTGEPPTGIDVKGPSCYEPVRKADDTEKVRRLKCDSKQMESARIRNDWSTGIPVPAPTGE